jgi:hypothetical protein
MNTTPTPDDTPSEEQLKDLLLTLTDLHLSPRQREHLDAILRVAADIVEVDPDDKPHEPEFHRQFEAAFQPQAAKWLHRYVNAANSALGIESDEPIRRATPAMITP